LDFIIIFKHHERVMDYLENTTKAPVQSAFAAVQQDEEHVEGEAWGVDGDLLLDEDGNPEMDGMEIVNAEGEEGGEDGWDVS
jgi:hypothetical protein